MRKKILKEQKCINMFIGMKLDVTFFGGKRDNEVYKNVELNKQSVSKITNKESVYSIPEGVKTIGNRCVDGCSSLTSIQLPSSLTNMNDCSFSGTNIKIEQLLKILKLKNKFLLKITRSTVLITIDLVDIKTITVS